MRYIIIIVTLATLALTVVAQQTVNKDWARLERYASANVELNKTPNDGNRVVMLGNSITEQWAVLSGDFFTRTGYVGRGISGQTSYQLLVRFRQDVIELNPRVVVIGIGTNDIAENTGPYSEDGTMGNIMTMCELAQAHGIKVLLASVLPCDRMYWSKATGVVGKVTSLNARIKAYAAASGYPYVDYYTPLATAGGALKPAYTRDGVHPNAAGYAVM